MTLKPENSRVLTAPPLKGACGRADLLLALATVQTNAVTEISAREKALAKIYGFYPKPQELRKDAYKEAPKDHGLPKTEPSTAETKLENEIFQPFRLVAVETVQYQERGQSQRQEVRDTGKLTAADMNPWDSTYPMANGKPIVPWTRLWPKLRHAVACRHHAGIDYQLLTDSVARGTAITQLPRKTRLAWPTPLTVIMDFSDRLTTYWEDWHWLRALLQSRLHQRVRFLRLYGPPNKPLQALKNGRPTGGLIDWPKLTSASTLLIVSDLGMVDPAHPWPTACWQKKLNELQRQAARVVVLAPVSTRHLQAPLVNLAQTVRLSPDSSLRPIGRMRINQESLSLKDTYVYAGCHTLLAMMSVATRIEPALLRELRQCLPDDGRDAGLDGEVWCHPHLDTITVACALSPYAVESWRDAFLKLDKALQLNTLECLRKWHARLPQAIHHEETLLWCYLTNQQDNVDQTSHINRARQFFQRVTNSLKENKQGALNPETRALQIQLADRHVQWVSPVLASKESYITALSVAVTEADSKHVARELPMYVNPIDWLLLFPKEPLQNYRLIQESNLRLSLKADGSANTPETSVVPLTELELDRTAVLWYWDELGRAVNYQIWVLPPSPENAPKLPGLLCALGSTFYIQPRLCIHTGKQILRFERVAKPGWASELGQDRFGLYADLEVIGITQRFRWINPGSFMMGSPETELERLADELQHQVTIGQGYWLADTACTQSLWTAVMVEIPNQYKDSPEHPVEMVSWDDIQAFIQRLNLDMPDVQARLPTEAEWEYACRAGTSTAFSFGDNVTTDQVNYDGNYPYAGAAEGEYRGKTVPVKTLPPNPWGLYEMHGNVWEWCQDWYGDYISEPVLDPQGPEMGTYRVLRGGSWRNFARGTRSANRDWRNPDVRYVYSGFRLALGEVGVSHGRQAVAGRTVGAEPDGPAGRGVPESHQRPKNK